MKIVFCGPPHSGKSVFIANLIDKLPTDAYTIIRACPDGEGNWSNNKKQDETAIVRKKGKFTEQDIKIAKEYFNTAIDDTLENENRIIDNYLMMELLGTDSLEEKCEKMNKVTKKEIIKVAKKVKMDTVFCLEGIKDERD